MSYLDTTIGDPRTRHGSGRRTQAALVGGSLLIGMAMGYVVARADPAAEPIAEAVARIPLSQEEFFRLNTTDLDGLGPVVVTTPALPVEDRGFLYLNTTAIDGLVPRGASAAKANGRANQNFMYWNVDSLERPAPPAAERPGFPR
jgi:hypothetical protein